MESASHAISSALPTSTGGFLSPIFAWTDSASDTLSSNSTFFGLNSTKDLLQIPTLLLDFPRYLLETTGLLAIADNDIAAPVAEAVGEGAAQAADAGPVWLNIVADAFSASTFKSYLGMLQYVTSRWAFTCFAVASYSTG
ncbi:uncharacterized protein AB675_1647 [Cyphellophora attinorum]|uniref:Uncharacterized protein n=1 Tax=Cyphellophora attinorum TaxID=1664694 RepID=A0A0N1H565_9EURO|nr:uncharacterized protein AB675_1647 [Phialophora attinorum]KPI36062.1 hypothetical protein AB675_1647 [Phialophora attinorum]